VNASPGVAQKKIVEIAGVRIILNAHNVAKSSNEMEIKKAIRDK
jgi:hypothetical protein